MRAELAGGVAIRYTDTAAEGVPDRCPVLLVHGYGSNFEANWGRTGWPTALTGEGIRTIGPDLRGHGGSEKPRDPAAYLPEVFAADLERLLDTLALERVDVVGYSMGSRLVWELALRRPGRIRRAVLAGFGPADAFAGIDLDRLDAVAARRPGDAPGPAEAAFADLYRMAAALPGNDPAALAACARGQAARPFTPEPVPEGVPVLFAAGQRDTLAAGAADLAAACGADYVTIPRRDHVNAVSARAFKRAVIEFLT